MGLGLTGEAAAGFLIDQGARVIVSEARPEAELGAAPQQLRAAGAAVETGGHRREVFADCDMVIVSPGVPPALPALEEARSRDAQVISEVELASRFLEGRIIGITGSNGKSTVTALTAAMLGEAGFAARACGNIGLPLIALHGPPSDELFVKDLARAERRGGDAPGVIHVAEISSFQLEAIESFRPCVAALLNLSPDHQDRYDGPSSYYAAKARIFMNQTGEEFAVLNADDPRTWALAGSLRARVRGFSLKRLPGEGVLLREDGRFVQVTEDREIVLFSASDVRLPGRHNLENVAAAAAVALSLGADPGAIRRAVASFTGLPHRMQFVRRVRGAAVYDDSKATNIGSAARAVESFDAPVVLLLGGRHKGGDPASLAPRLAGRVRQVITFGEAGPILAESLGRTLPAVSAGPLREAVRQALEAARPGDVVLLAPACASFDAYADYAARGDDFQRIVNVLAEGGGGS